MKDDGVYLRHIRQCIERIEEYTSAGHAAFLASRMAQDAVLRNLQTMAESTQRLSHAARNSRPEVEWPRIAAFRNVLVHDYLGVDIERVWQVIERDMPVLRSAVETLLGASD